jgi:hypothetical protein
MCLEEDDLSIDFVGELSWCRIPNFGIEVGIGIVEIVDVDGQ